MEVSYIFYKELLVLDENIFSSELTKNNEAEEIILAKNKRHLLTSMEINQKSDGEIIETKKNIPNVTAATIYVLAEKAKSYSFTCQMEMENLFSTKRSFEKKMT